MAKNYSFFSFFIWIFVCDHYWQYFKIKDILFTSIFNINDCCLDSLSDVCKPNFFQKISLSIHDCSSKYKKSGLTESFSLELKEQLLGVFQYEKIYMDSGLNLSMLAEKDRDN